MHRYGDDDDDDHGDDDENGDWIGRWGGALKYTTKCKLALGWGGGPFICKYYYYFSILDF